MKKSIFSGLIAVLTLAAGSSFAQRTCGSSIIQAQLQREQPETYRKLREDQLRKAREAQEQPAVASKTAATQSPIPVVFHIIVSQSQYATLGRDTGIRRRVASQLAALNRDFNRKNADSALIPAAFKSRYANANIQFGLANASNPQTTVGAGIELKIITTAPNYDVNNGIRAAKETLPSWDPTKYLNIWVIKTPSDILGVTISPSLFGQRLGDRRMDETDFGVVLSMGAFGAREFPAQTFTPNIDQGRTLTHEVGHFFELFHIWGDDDNSTAAGYCPGQIVAGQQEGYDDGISDTPPQSRRTYCDFPNHGGSNCPTYPLTDACSPTVPGIMFMNFMDYVDDRAMQMFTTNQVAVMRAQIAENGGPSFLLTQSPGAVSLSAVTVSPDAFRVYPNPAGSTIHISLSGSEQLQRIELRSLTGQVVQQMNADGRRLYELQTGTLPRGLYFVQCRFAEGSVSRKIVLQ